MRSIDIDILVYDIERFYDIEILGDSKRFSKSLVVIGLRFKSQKNCEF